MEKLLVLLKDEIVDELELDKPELMLGRDTSSDLRLNDNSVSRRHVRLTRSAAGCIVEDLGSTNGTLMDGRPIVGELVLKPGDTLKIGIFHIRYESDAAYQEPQKTAEPEPEAEFEHEPISKGSSRRKLAILTFVSGPDKGRSETLKKGLFTIGKPGAGVGTVARRPQGFFLIHVGGDIHPKANGVVVESGGLLLQDGDLLEVGEHRVRIVIKEEE